MEKIYDQFIDFLAANLPRLVTAIAIFVIGWIIAYAISAIIRGILKKTNLDNRLLKLNESDGTTQQIKIEDTISKTVFYFLLLIVVVATLQALRLQGVTEPLNDFIRNVLNFLPKLFGAGALLFLAWVIARLVKVTLRGLLQTFNLDEKIKPSNVASKIKNDSDSEVNTESSTSPSLIALVSNTAYWLVFLFFLPIILDVLNLNGLLDPLTQMLAKITGAIPHLFAAVILLGVAYFAAKVLSDLITSILTGIGFNSILSKLGFTKTQVAIDNKAATPSVVIGKLALIYVMLFAGIEALSLLQFESLTILLTRFVALTANILLGLVVFAAGLFLSNIAANAIKDSNINFSEALSLFARIAILTLSGGMALAQMGLAENVVNLAFGLTLGALAVAFALAFGLGGKDTAGELFRDFVNSLKKKQ